MAEKINITFLGTGSAIPTAKRNHPAVLLQYKDENILFDCGEGTQRQFRKAHLNPCKLTRIFITHWHADHVLGIPGLLQTLMLNSYNKTLHIYGPSGTEKMMQLYIGLFAYKGQNYPIKVHEINFSEKGSSHNAKDSTRVCEQIALDKSKIESKSDLGIGWVTNKGGHLFKQAILDTKEFTIDAESMEHDTPSLAYSFTIKEKSRLDKKKLSKLKIPSGKLVGELARGKTIKFKGKTIKPKSLVYKEPQRKVTIIMDTIENPKTIKLAKNSDLLICESTYNEQGKDLAKKHKHLTAKQAATIAKKSKAKQLVLTHLSQRNESNPKVILNQAKKVFKNATIASDLDKLEI